MNGPVQEDFPSAQWQPLRFRVHTSMLPTAGEELAFRLKTNDTRA
jgi:hypothetical protein